MATIHNKTSRWSICENCPFEFVRISPPGPDEIEEPDPDALNLVAFCVHERACLRSYAAGVEYGTKPDTGADRSE